MFKRPVKQFLYGTAACVTALAGSSLAYAQSSAEADGAVAAPQQDDGVGLGDIVVTAQSRAQRLQDVPVAVSAMEGSLMVQQGIQRQQDLQVQMPSFKFTETGLGTNIFLRGIGSGNNQAFEQSVGLFIDNVHYPRAQQTRAPFFDLERLEVLRGPQSILFGKNAIAGALNISTAKPTDTLSGYAQASYEFNQNDYSLEGAISGPLAEGVRARIAGRYRNGDGFIDNLALGRSEPQRKDWSLRGTVEADITDNLTALVKVEHGNFDSRGRAVELFGEKPVASGPFAGRTFTQILTALGANPVILNNVIDNKRTSSGDYSNNKQGTYALNLDWTLGDYSLRSTTAYTTMKYDELCDCDFTSADTFRVFLYEKYNQFSQEIRLTSPHYDHYDFIVGAYYERGRQRYRDNIEITSQSLLIPIVNSRTPGAGDLLANTYAPRTASTDADHYSAFAQANIRPFDERLTLQLGARVSRDTKDGFRTLSITGPNGAPLPAGQVRAPLVWAQALGITSTNLADLGAAGAAFIDRLGSLPVAAKRKETRFSPDVKLLFQPDRDTLVYASYARGNKSGGFDFRSNNKSFYATNNDAFEFSDESAVGIELGAKKTLLGGKAQVSLTAYHEKIKNLQVSVFDGQLGFNVGNAAAARVQGLEGEWRVRATRNITVSGTLAYTDFKYLNFRLGQCYVGQTPDVDGNGDGIADLCDYTGKSGQLVSDYSGTISVAFDYPVFGSYRLSGNTDVFYASANDAGPNYDPALRQSGYAFLNARVAFGPESKVWEIAFLGRNLTDKQITSYGGDVPLSGSAFGAKTNYAFRTEGRTLAIQLRSTF